MGMSTMEFISHRTEGTEGQFRGLTTDQEVAATAVATDQILIPIMDPTQILVMVQTQETVGTGTVHQEIPIIIRDRETAEFNSRGA